MSGLASCPHRQQAFDLRQNARHDTGDATSIIRELEKATVEIARPVEEGERQAETERQRWEVQREQWRREEEARRGAKALKDSKEELLQVIDTSAEAKRLDAFFADAERRAQDLPEEQRERTIERRRRARALIGTTDALEQFRRMASAGRTVKSA